ncbi:hypothetical protein SAMN05216474_2438 [Lishizhenia tianjinensis]|uniref:Outer membrane protein beta-barrel domain-containing protein n=1 Tax=Lishizhenia tianjinensis TaxID=477690 RepID=A0A1I7B0D3_9FLAO|nr:hypothetical protein [Lishizhenia tianjinensis]SFT80647.1 hypothetical protein SAMN05216474_2438 [Lishizhenia tianjinensis]
MRIFITLLTLVILHTSTAQKFQSFSVFGGIEQKGFREAEYYSGQYNISAQTSLTLPSLRFGATYKLGARTQLFTQISNQKLYDAQTIPDYYGANYRSYFSSNQRVLDLGVRRHKKYAPLGGYIGLNLLLSSTNIVLTESENSALSDLSGNATNLGLKFTWGKTKLVGNNFFIDWGISYQYYPTFLNLFSSNDGQENESYNFYKQDGDRTVLKDDFKFTTANYLIDRCGRIAFYFNIGFASIGIK